jgi:multicomponent Na+:H+ antiporter subunit G
MSPVVAVVSGVFLVVGVSLMVIAGVALQRLPDALARANAATKAAGLGLACVLAGTAVGIGTSEAYVKLGLAIVLQFLAAPTAGHVIGRAAYRSGATTSKDLDVDDIAALDPDERP